MSWSSGKPLYMLREAPSTELSGHHQNLLRAHGPLMGGRAELLQSPVLIGKVSTMGPLLPSLPLLLIPSFFSKWPRLALIPGSSCLCLSCVGDTGVHHHTWPSLILWTNKCVHPPGSQPGLAKWQSSICATSPHSSHSLKMESLTLTVGWHHQGQGQLAAPWPVISYLKRYTSSYWFL